MAVMPIRPLRRAAAPILVVAGAALFGLGAGGIARVDARLEAASRPAAQPQQQAPRATDAHHGVRGVRPQPHREEF